MHARFANVGRLRRSQAEARLAHPTTVNLRRDQQEAQTPCLFGACARKGGRRQVMTMEDSR